MKSKPVLRLAAIFTLIASASTIATAASKNVIYPRDSRKPAPEFHLPDAANHTQSITAYKGRVLLLDFWATWCGGCKTELPWYMEFADKYKSQGLSALGVSMDDEGWKLVRPFIAQKHLSYPTIIATPELTKTYNIDEMPVTLLIDRNGKVAASFVGLVDKAGFETQLQKLLAEPR